MNSFRAELQVFSLSIHLSHFYVIILLYVVKILICHILMMLDAFKSHTSSFCACESGSVSDVFPCDDVSSLSHDPGLHLLP